MNIRTYSPMLPAIIFFAMLLPGCRESDGYIAKIADLHRGDVPTPSKMVQIPADPVVTERVVYFTEKGQSVTGFLAYPKDMAASRRKMGIPKEAKLPGIIVIHEWWGLNENIEAMAKRLAGEGYIALSVDLYHGNVAETSQDARKYMSAATANIDEVRRNLQAAYAYLKNKKNAGRVGSVGWCFGGGMSLQAALAMPDKLDATAIYYGRLVTNPETLKPLEMPLIGFFGGNDGSIPVDVIRSFESTLKDLGKSVDITIYEGAGHAFANPSGRNYQEKAATDSWNKTLAFFRENLLQQE